MANSKIVLGGQTLIDLTKDTVSEENLLVGYRAHGADGEEVNGTCDFDANTTTSKPAGSSEILSGKEAWANGKKIIGSMYNYGGNGGGDITSKDQAYPIPAGFHDGTGTVKIAETEKAKLISDNIREGVTILGVVGAMSGTEEVKAQNREVTSSLSDFEVLPESPYNYLASVKVKKIPVTYTTLPSDQGGGTVVKIG
jgi:hypothetical protein